MEKIKLTREDCNEDSNVDVYKYKTISRTELVDRYMHAINNAHAAFNLLISQNDEIGDRYNKVCAEANMLQAEIEKLKANNNNDLCIQLREEIACLKRDNELLREGKKVVETKNDDLVAANKSLEEVVRNSNEILKAIKILVS